MRLKLYRAVSVAEAMAQVRAELGPEALILSTRRSAEGVELTAALEPQDEPPAKPAPPTGVTLSSHGIPEPLATRLAEHDSADTLADILAANLRFADLPVAACQDEFFGRPLLLTGMPGAGKTLAIARLATRLVLAGIRPTVITADGRRAGAAEELAAYTRLLGVNLLVASTPATLVRALASAKGQDGPSPPVLIDTSGVSPFVMQDIAAIATLAQSVDAVPILVMQAGLHPEDAAEQVRAFAPIGARHLLPTRLDLTRRLGSVLAAAMSGDLALTEAGIGPGATDALVALTPRFLADRLRASSPEAVPTPAGQHRRPVFPRARAHAEQSWSTGRG